MKNLLVSLLGLTLVAGAAQAAGRASVAFPDSDSYTDAGFDASDRRITREILAEHADRIARRLPDGQALELRFDDIDLAGRLEWHRLTPVRVVGSPLDTPRLRFHYVLRSGDQILQSGEESLVDMAYMNRLVGLGQTDGLVFERRMLDRWYVEKLAPTVASTR